MKVTVAIPTYNRKEKLKKLLLSLEESNFRDFEVIIVDDASSDGTDKMIREEFPDVRYIRHEKPTLVAKSRNDAIEASKGEYIFFIDDDNVVEGTTIEKLVEFLDNHEDVGVVAPVTCWYTYPDKIMYAGAILSKFTRRTIPLFSGRPCKELEVKVIEADIFANSYAIRREAINKAGLIPWKRIPWNGEDGYLHYKIKKLGYRNVTLGSARVYHDVPISEGIKRYNRMRLYYAIRSKIVFHKDLDEDLQKLTFYLSTSAYLGYYLYIATKLKCEKCIKAVLQGYIDGILDGNELKYI
ncbi:glycosyltransferase family 2 protein [Metallosphaera tengchongensis]|uniref:Glycosyltransferase family 2 protein n=1 Tax=Metallosphaera tengchongensis TaxID=1532350 RepID=A0A6N0P0F4_9CREN|nr:glycosyltransferase family 2 protein [Metallosphaera tengchongensis]QKR00851.1 glycosyltransferase family 2 protein [Metallosphaera tengchongensis]